MVMQHGGPFAPGQTGYGDVNGDGKADMIFQGADNRFWLSLSTGTGFGTPQSAEMVMQHGGPFAPGQTGYGDVNGDGKVDMIFQGTDNHFWLSTGVNALQSARSAGYYDGYLNMINAPAAWAAGYTGLGVKVAVVDSGIDTAHGEFTGRILPGFVNGGVGNTPQDGHGHGTHVSGVIAASRDSNGNTGVAYNANIIPIRVLGNDNKYRSLEQVSNGIIYAVNTGARILNLSIGEYGAIQGDNSSLREAIAYALSKNVLVVASSGNEAAEASIPDQPARFSNTFANLISVGNHDGKSSLNSSSQKVGRSGAVQVDAPGTNVYSTVPFSIAPEGYGTYTGTSMAAPHVAGVAALALSANPALSASELRSILVYGANRGINGSDSNGGINAALTLAIAANSAGGISPSTGLNPPQSTTASTAQARQLPLTISSGSVPLVSPKLMQGGGSSSQTYQSTSISHPAAVIDSVFAQQIQPKLAQPSSPATTAQALPKGQAVHQLAYSTIKRVDEDLMSAVDIRARSN